MISVFHICLLHIYTHRCRNLLDCNDKVGVSSYIYIRFLILQRDRIPGDLQKLTTDLMELFGTKISGILQKDFIRISYNDDTGSKENYNKPSIRAIIDACKKCV